MLRACLFGAPVITAATKVGYPLSNGKTGDASGDSVSFYGRKGNLLMRALGFRSGLEINFTEGEAPYLGFKDGIGILPANPAAVAPGVPVLPVYPDPVEVNTVNTDLTLFGQAIKLRSLNIDFGLKVEYRSIVDGRRVLFGSAEDGDRRAISARLVAELPDPSVLNIFDRLNGASNGVMDLIHGTADGNIVELNSTKVLLEDVTFSEEQNVVMMNADLGFVPTAANNELTFSTR